MKNYRIGEPDEHQLPVVDDIEDMVDQSPGSDESFSGDFEESFSDELEESLSGDVEESYSSDIDESVLGDIPIISTPLPDKEGEVQQLSIAELQPMQQTMLTALPVAHVGLPEVSLSLEEAAKVAVLQHPGVAGAVNKMLEKEAEVSAAKANYLPSVSANFGVGREDASGDRHQAEISVSQLVYDFGKTGGKVRKSNFEQAEQEANFLKMIDEVALETAEILINVHMYQRLIGIAERKVEALAEVANITRWRAGAGVATSTDTMQAQTRLESVQADLLAVQSGLRQWRQKLKRYIGEPLPTEIAQPNDGFIKTLLKRYQQQTDYSHLPEVLMKYVSYQAAMEEVTIERAERFPDLILEGGATHIFNHDQYMNEPETNHTIMLTTSLPLYRGGGISSKIRAAKQRVAAAKQEIHETVQEVAENENLLAEQVKSNEERLELLAQRRETMFATSDLYWEQFQVGTRSVLDLLNGEDEKFGALTDEETAYHELMTARVQLVAARGQLREALALNELVIHGVRVLP